MVQILEGNSFGPQLGKALGGGIEKGASQAAQFAQQMQMERFKQAQRSQLIHGIYRGGQQGPSGQAEYSDQQKKKFLDILPELENKKREMTGEDLTPEDLDQIWQEMSQMQGQPQKQDHERLSQQFAAAGEHELASHHREMAKLERKEKIEQEKLKHKRDVESEQAIERSYEAQKGFIDKTTNAYKSFESDMKPKLLQMQKMNQDELIGPAAAKFLETIGVPLGVLENPSNELYDKVSQDLLKGLPETYGNKILLAEVQNFLKTIPRLVNSLNGRRMIASNMLKLGEMKEVIYNEMRRMQMNLLDSNERFPKDFEQRVFDNIKPQIDRLSNEFMKLSEIKAVPKGTVPYFNPQGGISFVPDNQNDIEWSEQNGGKRIW